MRVSWWHGVHPHRPRRDGTHPCDLAFDLDVEELDTSRRTFRHQLRKWKLSSDDHARIIRLLSETLNDQVATAVQNVSGRS